MKIANKYITALAMWIVCVAPSRAETCVQADHDFQVEKTEDSYRVSYRGRSVYELDFNALNDLYGGNPPATNCDNDLSSRDIIAIVAGWKRDLLVAFGIVRDMNGEAVKLNKLSWLPHNGTFDPIQLVKKKELLVHYGELLTRICWNVTGEETWKFNSNPHEREAGECNATTAPFGSDQYLIPID